MESMESNKIETTMKKNTNSVVVWCKGGHHTEEGKGVSGAGYCNLCIKDMQRRKPAGTTARERGLK